MTLVHHSLYQPEIITFVYKRSMNKLHPKQIPTKLKYIEEELYIRESEFESFLLKCIISEPGSAEQKNYMVAAASVLERFSCLVYKCNDSQYQKLALTTYYKSFFKHWAETPEEVFERVRQCGVTRDKAELIYKLLSRSFGASAEYQGQHR